MEIKKHFVFLKPVFDSTEKGLHDNNSESLEDAKAMITALK